MNYNEVLKDLDAFFQYLFSTSEYKKCSTKIGSVEHHIVDGSCYSIQMTLLTIVGGFRPHNLLKPVLISKQNTHLSSEYNQMKVWIDDSTYDINKDTDISKPEKEWLDQTVFEITLKYKDYDELIKYLIMIYVFKSRHIHNLPENTIFSFFMDEPYYAGCYETVINDFIIIGNNIRMRDKDEVQKP